MSVNSTNHQQATFAAGCFWGVQTAFDQLEGVVETAVGYMGGRTEDPSYKEVCGDDTGHAEVVHVVFDPAKVDYSALVEHFYRVHNPTTLNRQGPDIGDQYRSAIFFHSPEQEAVARQVTAEMQARFKSPIVTQITAAGPFWRGEEYHQKYFEKRGMGESCHRWNW
jgi:peptide-methionine (S)-S-oxide reductase